MRTDNQEKESNIDVKRLKAQFKENAIRLSECLKLCDEETLYHKLTGTLSYGLLLKHVAEKHKLDASGNIQLDTWVGDRYYYAAPADEIGDKLHLASPTIRRGVKRLKNLNFVEYLIKCKNNAGYPCYHLALNFDNLISQAKNYADN